MTTSGLNLPSSCTFCTRNIHHSFHFQCAECNDPPVFLCVDCFSAGVNVGDHLNTHAYRVPDCLDNPMFAKDWTIKEELMLLDGIQKYGVGNWKTISEYLKTNKSTKHLEDHYWELYMGRHGYCLPTQCLVNGEILNTSSFFNESNKQGYQIDCNGDYQRGEIVQRDLETFLPSTNGNGAPIPAPKFKDRNEALQRIAQLPGADLPGYMPLREDFEIEYENDAETMLADMEFSPDDHPSEIELKLQVIRIYNTKLAERDRRKRFVIDRGLIDVKGQQAKEKRLSKEERDLVGKLRIFSRFQTQEEHELLVEGLLKARRLKQQLELYKLYQKMGLTTLQEVKQYEMDKKNQEKEIKFRKVRESAPYLFKPTPSSNNTTSSNNAPPHASQSIDDNDNEDTVSSNNDSNNNDNKGSSKGGGSNKRSRGRGGAGGGGDSSSNLSTLTNNKDSGDQKRMRSSRSATRSMANANNNNSIASTPIDYNTSSAALLEDIERMRKAPHGHLLTDLELELCVRVPLFPSYYIEAKRVLLKEAYRTGMITSEGVQRTLKLNVDQCSMIYDFFIKEMKAAESQKSSSNNNGTNNNNNNSIAV